MIGFNEYCMKVIYEGIVSGELTLERFKEEALKRYITESEAIRIYNEVRAGTITKEDFVLRGTKYVFKN